MSSITPNTPREEPEAPGTSSPPSGAMRAPSSSLSFLTTLFVFTAGLAVLAVIGIIAGSAWFTANQRAEAENPLPWVNPSFTTTSVTTGGLLARWMDVDGNLDNGHTYIQGIYNLWKTRHLNVWAGLSSSNTLGTLPPLWRVEFARDLESPAARDVAREMLDEAKEYVHKHESATKADQAKK